MTRLEITLILLSLPLSLLLWLALVGIAQWLRDIYHVRCAILAALERLAEKDEVAKP